MNEKFEIRIDKQFAIVSALLVVVNFILEIYYIFFLSTNFNYLGFKDQFSIIKYIEIKLFLVFFVGLSYYVFKKSHFVYAVYILLLLFFFIPNSIMYAFMDHIRGPLYSIVLLLILVASISTVKIKIRTLTTSIYFKYFFISIISLIFLIPVIVEFGSNFNLNTLFLKDIYETRDVFTENISSRVNYFYNWEVKIVVPVLLVFFLIKKKYLLAILSFLILIYLFIISGNKSVYLTSMITIFFFFVGGKSYVKKIKYFLLFLVFAFIAIPIVDVFVLNGFLLRGTFVMRTFYFPALLNYCYFDFFKDAPLYFSENHFFNLFFHSPYKLNSAYLISETYFNTSEMYANNGIISDGYKNLGYWGVLILSTLFAGIFTFFNSISVNSRYFGIFFIFVFFFLSTPMMTVFVTGGLWMLFLFGFTLLKPQKL